MESTILVQADSAELTKEPGVDQVLFRVDKLLTDAVDRNRSRQDKRVIGKKGSGASSFYLRAFVMEHIWPRLLLIYKMTLLIFLLTLLRNQRYINLVGLLSMKEYEGRA